MSLNEHATRMVRIALIVEKEKNFGKLIGAMDLPGTNVRVYLFEYWTATEEMLTAVFNTLPEEVRTPKHCWKNKGSQGEERYSEEYFQCNCGDASKRVTIYYNRDGSFNSGRVSLRSNTTEVEVKITNLPPSQAYLHDDKDLFNG